MTLSTSTVTISMRGRWRARRHYLVAALIFAAFYLVYIVVAPPQAEFPLNDDWGYSQAVRHLLNTGELRISDWASATTISQTYWGAVFARLLGGFSLGAMRWSTLAFSFIAILGLYDLLLQLNFSHRVALFGSVIVLVSPMFGYLSYTFMSDIFYFGLMALSISTYLRGIRRRAVGWLLVGSIFAALAFLTRQLGAVLPVAAALALLLRERRFVWKQLLAVATIPAITGGVYFAWLQIVGTPWALQFFSLQGTVDQLAMPLEYIPRTILRVLLTAFYLGLLILPAVLAMVISRRSKFRARSRVFKIYVVWLVALGTFALVIGRPMPYLANVVNWHGLGTLTLLGQKEPITPGWVFGLVTLVAPFVGAVQGTLWTEVILYVRRELRRPAAILLLTGAGMAVLILIVFVYFWDEYLFVFAPIGLYLTLRGVRITRAGWVAALLACVLIGAYTWIELGDHMAWNAARWEAGQRLVQQGVPPGEIDGGLEWVGWYEFETALPQAIAAGRRNELWAWYDWTPHRYYLAFEPLEGYRVIDRVEYHTPLIGRVGYVYILTKAQP
jgi:hypothetical protein